jgi:hypothetical protein
VHPAAIPTSRKAREVRDRQVESVEAWLAWYYLESDACICFVKSLQSSVCLMSNDWVTRICAQTLTLLFSSLATHFRTFFPKRHHCMARIAIRHEVL